MKNLKSKSNAILFMLLLFLSMSLSTQAQAVLSIFKKYGYEQGVTMIQASRSLMKDYKIRSFKSIAFDDGTCVLPEIRRAIKKDIEGALCIKESFKNGLLTSGYYQLVSEKPKLNRYLIFKIGEKNKTTLIYIEGELTADDLVELLK